MIHLSVFNFSYYFQANICTPSFLIDELHPPFSKVCIQLSSEPAITNVGKLPKDKIWSEWSQMKCTRLLENGMFLQLISVAAQASKIGEGVKGKSKILRAKTVKSACEAHKFVIFMLKLANLTYFNIIWDYFFIFLWWWGCPKPPVVPPLVDLSEKVYFRSHVPVADPVVQRGGSS